LGTHEGRVLRRDPEFFAPPVSERLRLVRGIHKGGGQASARELRNHLEYRHGKVFDDLSPIHGKPCQTVSSGNAGFTGGLGHRFSKNNQRILLWSSDNQADWWITADTEESLSPLIEAVRHCDQVGQSLWSNSERGESLLSGTR
jgi:hypothetical protein